MAVLQRRMILRLPETQRCRDACGSGLHGIRADPSPAQELPRAFECPKPFLERRQDSDDDVLLCPEGRRSIWRLFAKPKQARNFKDLKHLKCRCTFRIGADLRTLPDWKARARKTGCGNWRVRKAGKAPRLIPRRDLPSRGCGQARIGISEHKRTRLSRDFAGSMATGRS